MSQLTKDELKSIFVAGAIPTEAQFASLIDSQVNLRETASTTESIAIDIPNGFINLQAASVGDSPFYGILTASPLTGSNAAFHGGPAFDYGQPLPNSPYIKTNGGFDILLDNGNAYGNSSFRIYKDTGIAGVGGSELLKLNESGSLTISGSSFIRGSITASGNISASGTIIADTFQSSTSTLSVNDSLNITGNVTASGAISASGNLIIGGTSTLNGDVTIPKSVKLYFDSPSGLHVYSEGTATDENQIILAKTNNLRILNQAHGKDIIFGTENASGTAKTPLTLSGSGDAVFGENIIIPGNVSSSGTVVGTNITTTNASQLTALTASVVTLLNRDVATTSSIITLLGKEVAATASIVLQGSQIAASTGSGNLVVTTVSPTTVSASGVVSGLTGSFIGGLSLGAADDIQLFAPNTDITAKTISASGNILTNNITASGAISASSAKFTGDLQFTTDATDHVIQQHDGAEVARIHDGGATNTDTDMTSVGFGLGYKIPIMAVTADGGDKTVTLDATDSGTIIQCDADTNNIIFNLPVINAASKAGIHFTFVTTTAVNASKTITINTNGTDGNDNFLMYHIISDDTVSRDVAGDTLTIPNSAPIGTVVKVTCLTSGAGNAAELWLVEAFGNCTIAIA